MNFGLGLVLSFTDNATAGINSASTSLMSLTQTAENASSKLGSLSALSVVSGQLGNAFTGAGKGIISTLSQVISTVNDAGQTLMYAEQQLDTLYKSSGKTGAEVLSRIQKYAKETQFNFEDLVPAVTGLKSVGIEAFDSITSSAGNAGHSLLDYANALYAFNKNMHNQYGTGIKAAIGSLKEYIAEGNARSLLAGAGLDITAMLGEDKGATVEERTRQVADLIEQIGMLGMIDAMKNNPMTQLSNMEDVLFQFKGLVAESGVYQKFTDIIGKLAGYIMSIPEEELESLAKIVGDALTTIMQPLDWVVDKIISLVDGIRNLVANNPGLIKTATVVASVAGVLFLITGIILKVTSAFSGLSLMLLASGKTFKSISGLFMTGSIKMLAVMLPLVVLFKALSLAWKKDFGGIRTDVTNFVTGVTTAFKTARELVNGDVKTLSETLDELRNKGDFFSNITIGITKLMMVFRAIGDFWNDDTLSAENFEKARELGVLPLITSIFMLKFRLEKFVKGFVERWKELISGFTEGIKGTALEKLIDGVGELLKKLASGDSQAWYEFGKSFADFSAGALALWAVIKAIGLVSKVLTPVFKLFKGISNLKMGGVFGKIATGIRNIITVFKGGQGVGVFTKLIEVMRAVVSGGMSLKDAMTVVFGGVTTTISGIVSVVSGAIMAVVGFFKQLTEGFSWFWEIIKWVGIALAVVGAIILGASAWPAVLVGAIVGALTTIIVLVKDNWNAICAFFSTIGAWIYDNVIKPVADFFVGLWNGIVTGAKAVADFFVNVWNGIVNGVMTAVNAIKNFFSTVIGWINTNIIQPIVWFFTQIIFPIIAKIVEIVSKIIEIIVVLLRVLVQWVYNNIIKPIGDFFVGLWNGIVSGVMTAVNAIKNFFGTIANWINTNIIIPVSTFFTNLWNKIVGGIRSAFTTVVNWINTNVITPISTFFTNLWNGIVSGVTAFIEGVKSVFSTIVSWIKNKIIDPISKFFKNLWEGITTAFNTVADTITNVLKGAVNMVLDFICGLINGVINGINWAIDVINAIPGVSITKIELLEVPRLAQGGVVDKPTMAVVGEAGTEAVMPLENNTGWIGKLANMLSSEMHSMTPTNSSAMVATNNQNSGKQRYLTNNTNNNNTYEGDTDNSVTFNKGAIQVVVQNASEAEAIKLAKLVMNYIKRQKELDKMLKYA